MPTSSRYLLPPLLLLSPPSLVAHADPSLTGRAFQVEAVIADGYAFDIAISDSVYDLGTLSSGTLGNLASPANIASSSEADSIVLTCTPGMTVSAALDYGASGGSSSQRYLKRVSGNETLVYRPHQDAVYSQVWGNRAFARTIANFPASTQTYTVYARLSAVDSLPSTGNYHDTVIVTPSL